MKTEPFLKNPQGVPMAGLLMLNPKRRKKVSRRKSIVRARPKVRRVRRKIVPVTPKVVMPAPIIISAGRKHKRRKKGVGSMARRGGKFTRFGRLHALSVYRAGSGFRIAPKSRLVRRYRGRIINPLIPSRGELMTVAGITGGFVASRYLPRLFEKMLPPALMTGLPRVGVQTATGLAASYVVGNVLKQRELGRNMTTGTLLNAAISLVDMYLLRGVLAEEGIAALAENVPEVVGESPADTPATLPAGFADDGESEEMSAEQDVIVM